MRRLFWVAVGLGAGVTIAVQLSRWTRRQLGSKVGEFIDEYRKASAQREAEIRARLDAESTLP